MHLLKSGDFVNCRIQLKPQEEHLLLDLVSRGVKIFPSATAQLASRSKTYQARIFPDLMIPFTRAIYDLHDLMEAITSYNSEKIKDVVVKLDRKNAGMGILKFTDPEAVYTTAVVNNLQFPFVMQPYMDNFFDLRIIILGDYIEAYKRNNPNNFRQNLHNGAKATPVELTVNQLQVCKKAMLRGGFPYCHLDLLISPDQKSTYLTEVNLRGGIKGAKITPEQYQQHINEIHSHQTAE